MQFRRKPPKGNYAMVDKAVLSNLDLSEGARFLYAFLCGLYEKGNYNEAYLMKSMNLGRRTLIRRKKELKAADLLCVEQYAPRAYCAYLGTMKYPASQVMADIKQEEMRDQTPSEEK